MKQSIIITLDGSDQDVGHLMQALGRAVDGLPDTAQGIVSRRVGNAAKLLTAIDPLYPLIDALRDASLYRFDHEEPPECRLCDRYEGDDNYCIEHTADIKKAEQYDDIERRIREALQS